MLTAGFVLVASLCVAQQPPNCALGGFIISPDETIWVCKGTGQSPVQLSTGGGGIPSGANIFIDSGSCPEGYTENTALSGKTLIGTTAAAGNVGTTGGSDTITPEGTISAITQVISHTHTVSVNDPGHTHPEGYRNTGTAGTAGVQGASTANNASIAGGVLSATTGITATTANPAGGVASITPTFTGTQFDNRSEFVRVIVCKKT